MAVVFHIAQSNSTVLAPAPVGVAINSKVPVWVHVNVNHTSAWTALKKQSGLTPLGVIGPISTVVVAAWSHKGIAPAQPLPPPGGGDVEVIQKSKLPWVPWFDITPIQTCVPAGIPQPVDKVPVPTIVLQVSSKTPQPPV